MRRFDELDIPNLVGDAEDAVEFVRFWVADNEDIVALKIGAFAADAEADQWGMIAADILKHAVLGMLQDDPSRDEAVLVAEMERAFHRRLNQKTNFSGTLGGERH